MTHDDIMLKAFVDSVTDVFDNPFMCSAFGKFWCRLELFRETV